MPRSKKPKPWQSLDTRITVRLSRYHLIELDAVARKEGFSSSQIVRHLVIRYLEDKRRFSQRTPPLPAFMRREES